MQDSGLAGRNDDRNTRSSLLLLLLRPPLFAPLAPARDHRFRFEVRKQALAHLLNQEASDEVDDHRHRQLELELQQQSSASEAHKGMQGIIRTMFSISTICSQRLSSGMKSVEPEKATAEAPTRPQYSAGFSRMPSRKGRPWKLMANVDTC